MTTPSIQIPFVDIAGQHAPIKTELLEAIGAVIDHGQFVQGAEVSTFEERFAQLCGVRFAVGVSSGTDALIMALRALGVGPGDEVITVPNSFVASTACISLVGAKPVFVDVREDYNMDPSQIERAITSKTKVLLPVHLTGRPADMDPMRTVARAQGLHIVEDCSQAVMAEYRGQRVGSFGTIGCFSLHPLKTLSACGDAGMLTTNDEDLCNYFNVARSIGLRSRDECEFWSTNSRLDTIQAAILLVKLKYLDTWTEQRRSNAAHYQEALANIRGCCVPRDQIYEKAVYHTFVIQAERRNELRQYLADHGVQTAIHYPNPIHLQQAAAGLGYGSGSFPVAERQAERILSLPIYPQLKQEDLNYIAQTIRRFHER